jgi:hypothetical protein
MTQIESFNAKYQGDTAGHIGNSDRNRPTRTISGEARYREDTGQSARQWTV